MRPLVVLAVALGLSTFGIFMQSIVADTPKNTANGKLWVGITVNEPVFVDNPRQVLIHLAVVNDSDKLLNPELDSSELLVNGKVLKDWDLTIRQGPRDERFKALPPRDSLRLGFDLTNYFQAPDTYRVIWKGKGFQSAEIVFRVLPAGK